MGSDPEETADIPTSIRAVQDSRNADSCSRTLVICLDGTGDKFDNDNSNVVNFVACLKKDSASQITYYQSGIGTYDGHGMSRGFSAAVDMAVGSGLGVHIKDAYRFIMQYYQEGDKICLLGFSRGSYTVRCLAGMLHKVGLLPAGNDAQISFAYEIYKDDTPEGWKMSAEFKETFCTNVTVYFVGVWDCVASVGFIPRILPFSKSPTNTISYFRHAMSLDEHRAKFKCFISSRTKAQQELIEKKAATASKLNKDREEKLLESQFDKEDHTISKPTSPDVLEVWFAGAHCDVGGGAVPNETRHMLSRIPLRWMIRQCFACNTGIIFDTSSLADVGIDVPSVWPTYIPNKVPIDSQKNEMGTKTQEIFFHTDTFTDDKNRLLEMLPEQVEDHFDALQPINDMLKQAKGWWVLEIWPVKVKTQKKANQWEKKVAMNLGRFRPVQEIEPKMHWTVKLRMEKTGYKLKNDVAKDATWNLTA
ncbi:hypothetical protein OIDMADRAFT_167003 [Oidiodendron maius Zn]|uniref:T6SS Phospholipase effector Tle1-like catalytic domain-containing protein n=1 Tax=Oidiodendron maius (strain Zn) TaxID=913774 RepID=A0A0C3H817_OIDMZ|nr:hypothetical protein OIDMADRAFT_167003 [Oidiodendron maius Zn]